MNRTINVKVGGSHLTKDNKNAGVQHEANVTMLRVTFDAGWDGFAKKVTWWDALGMNPVEITLTTSLLEDIAESTRAYLVPIPKEPLAEAGWCTFVIDGYVNGKRQRSISDKLLVKEAPFIEQADQPTDPSPTQAEQLQVQIDEIMDTIQDAVKSGEQAAQSAQAAKVSEDNAKASEDAARASENAAKASENNAKDSETAAQAAKTGAETAQGQAEAAQAKAEQAQAGAETARGKAEDAQRAAELAQDKAESARDSAESARLSAEDARDDAAAFAGNADQSAQRAAGSEAAAAASATTAEESARQAAEEVDQAAEEVKQAAAAEVARAAQEADDAAGSATLSKSWAVGGTGARAGEDADNAKYYSEQAKAIVGGDFVTKTEAQGYVGTHDQGQDAHGGRLSRMETQLGGLTFSVDANGILTVTY